jgi:hypothetical protein
LDFIVELDCVRQAIVPADNSHMQLAMKLIAVMMFEPRSAQAEMATIATSATISPYSAIVCPG